MEHEYQMDNSNEYYERYYKTDCGICGKDRLCYATVNKETKKIHGYICRRCKDNIPKCQHKRTRGK